MEAAVANKLTEGDLAEIKRLIDNTIDGRSERASDRNRTHLKALGLIRFDRQSWQWEVLPAGRAKLAEERG